LNVTGRGAQYNCFIDVLMRVSLTVWVLGDCSGLEREKKAVETAAKEVGTLCLTTCLHPSHSKGKRGTQKGGKSTESYEGAQRGQEGDDCGFV
jgi:hypothetical protein